MVLVRDEPDVFYGGVSSAWEMTQYGIDKAERKETHESHLCFPRGLARGRGIRFGRSLPGILRSFARVFGGSLGRSLPSAGGFRGGGLAGTNWIRHGAGRRRR